MTEERKYDVVISGIAGVFPECDDVDELWTKLMKKDPELVTEDTRRWAPGELGVPAGIGKIREPNHFDMSFFGVSRRLCLNMDPLTKLCMEQAYRAVCDAGVNPADLSGSNVAVLMASVSSETEYDCVIRGRYMGQAMLGHSRTMQANRLSYFLNLKGPSLMMDSSWCGGAQGLQYAHDLVSGGHTTSAIVGACSLVYRPEVSTHYQAMGRLSPDSKTRSFSADANGYARSEGCVVFFLQRLEHARRSYGTVLSALSLSLGSRLSPFSELDEERYKQLLKDSYMRAKASPKDVAYLEAAGNASKEVDARELKAASEVLLKGRKQPLHVGSIKSNLGHCEGAASLVGAIKVALALDRGVIPPNLNYTAPNPDVPALVSGQMKVVTEPTELQGDLGASTEFGAAGNFSHFVLKRHPKVKKYRCKMGELPPDGLPRLIVMSDRADSNLLANGERLQEMPIDEEFVCLMNHVYKQGIKGHLHRGYVVLNGQDNNYRQIEQYEDNATRKPIWFMFSGMGSQWPAMGRSLMRLPIFAEAIKKCHETLLPKGVDLMEILTSEDPKIFDNILHSFIGIAAVQIALVDVLNTLGVKPDGIVGHSVGELGCAYADGCFTAEQMILSAYARGRASVETELIQGMMAAVGKGYNQIKGELPESIEVACHNSSTSCTLSGPTEDMKEYIEKLKESGVFAKLVNVANIAYHSRYIKPAAPALLRYLKEVILDPKPRSSRWISSSVPEAQWDSDLAKTSSAEYHTNNLLGSVLFEEASSHIPENAIVIEIAPHGLLQAIVKRSLPKAVHIPLTSRFDEDNLMFLLSAVGKMYIHGIPVDVEKLYPPVEFPVSRDTPAISPFIGWQHSEEYNVVCFDVTSCRKIPCWKDVHVILTEEKYSSLTHHKIKGRPVIPTSFYLGSIIEIFTDYHHNASDYNVLIEDLDCTKDIEIPRSRVDLFTQLHRGTGNFCFFSNGELVAKGRISLADKLGLAKLSDSELCENSLNGEELVSFMNSMGYNLSGRYAAIKSYSLKDHIVRGLVTWNGSITEFITNVFTLVGFYESKTENELRLVARAAKIFIDYTVLNASKDVLVEYNAMTRFITCDGLQVLLPETTRPKLSLTATKNVDFSIDTYEFVPYVNPNMSEDWITMSICSQLVVENLHHTQDKSCLIRVIEIGSTSSLLATLYKHSESKKTPQTFNYNTYANENEFFQRDMSFIHQEIIWVIVHEAPSTKLIHTLQSALTGYIIMPKGANKSDVNVLTEFTHNTGLYVLGTSLPKPKEFISLVAVNEDGSYLPVLKDALKKAAEENWDFDYDKKCVILAGKLQSATTTISIIEEAESLPHSNLVRYLFSDEVNFQTALSSNLYKTQISKDLKQNIYMRNAWGSFRSLPTEVKEAERNEIVNTAEKMLYPMSHVTTNADIKALGLNLSDVTGTLENDSLGLYDYATDKTMGIAVYQPNQKTYTPDPILKWDRPGHWTDCEAATVPLLYSMAASIVYFKNNPMTEGNNAIFVTNGLLPLSQAIISLAQYEKIEIFTTVGSPEEKDELLRMFPHLKTQNIFDHTRRDFYIHVQIMTKGRGIDKVVCNLMETDKVLSVVKSLAGKYGIAIMVSQATMDGRAQLGLLTFLDEAVAVGATPELILSSSAEEKTQLRDKIQTLLKAGAIQPFKNYTKVQPNYLNVDAVQTLKRSNKSKVVVQLKDSQVPDTKSYICNKDKNYVVICGQRQLDLWLDLVEWLLKRDARKITVFLAQMALSTVTTLRYQSLTQQYYGTKVHLCSMKSISSKASVSRTLMDIEARDGIDTIFFVGTDLRGKIQEIDECLTSQKSKSQIVCLGQGGESVCHKRHENGLPALCIKCGMDSLGPEVLRRLEQLLLESAVRPIVLLSEKLQCGAVLKNTKTGDALYVPETLPELTQLLRASYGNLNLVARTTEAPRLAYIKEIPPVFIMPGLKPNQAHNLYSSLFYPALEARIPQDCTNIDKLATTLVNDMICYPLNYFTIVGDGWGGILALQIGAKLEAMGKFSKVVLLDGAPKTIIDTATELLKDETALIDKYIKLSSKTENVVRGLSTWGEKLQAAIDGSNVDEVDGEIAFKAINLLRNRLRAVLATKPPVNKIKTKCHLIKYGTEIQDTKLNGLEDYLVNDHIIHVKEGETVEENLSLASVDVNSLVLFEYRDAANPPTEERMGVNILKNTTFDS